ncbi:MAG: Fe-S protein assembly co-chaperone HscB [Phycisphaerae bacterium]|nr:Fe-S protein assembly co-chaperone HscB [Phycisphaerae bacterium]
MTAEADKSKQAVTVKCASCNGPMSSPAFCDHCRNLYPADGLSHFELLGFEPSYDIDNQALRQKYLQVSRGVHPDHHGESGSSLSLRLSAQLNEANRILSDPVLRAEYLLELLGGPSAAQDRSVPPEVLSTTLMLREEIQEAGVTGDNAVLNDCRTRVRECLAVLLATISDLAVQLPGDDDLRSELRTALNSVKYYQRLFDVL